MSDDVNPFSPDATERKSDQGGHEYQQPPKKRSIWIWLLPLLLLLIATPIVCCGGLAWFGYSAVMKPVEACVEALNDDTRIAEKLGTPIESGAGFNVSEMQNNNGNGGATLEFNASGPKGSAKVEGRMKLIAGVWSPDDLTVTCSDGTVFQVPE